MTHYGNIRKKVKVINTDIKKLELNMHCSLVVLLAWMNIQIDMFLFWTAINDVFEKRREEGESVIGCRSFWVVFTFVLVIAFASANVPVNLCFLH